MVKKHNSIYLILTMLLIVVVGLIIPVIVIRYNSHDGNEGKKQYIDIVLHNPETGEVIGMSDRMKVSYTGEPVKPEIEVQLRESGRVLKDADMDDNNLQKHMILLINEKDIYEQQPWETGWPVEPGVYEVSIVFNNDGLYVGADEKYYRAQIYFTIQIVD